MSGAEHVTTLTPERATQDAVVYLRFSPKPDHAVSVDTIETQREICRRYCEHHRLNPKIELADELVSARRTRLYDRPNGTTLQSLFDLGIKHVVAVRLDRVFRDTADGLATLTQWAEKGVALHLADQGGCSLNCGTATGKLVVTMLLSVASYEPEITAERTRSSMLHKQAKGQRMTSEETLPWGVESDPNSPLHERSGRPSGTRPCYGELALSEELASLQKNTGLSLSAIAAQLNAKGMRCRGKTWDHAKVRRAIEAIND